MVFDIQLSLEKRLLIRLQLDPNVVKGTGAETVNELVKRLPLTYLVLVLPTKG